MHVILKPQYFYVLYIIFIQERRVSGCSCLPHYCTLHYLHRLLDSFKDPSKIDVWLSSTRDNLTLYPKNSLKIPAHLLLAAAAIFLQSTGSTELPLQVLLGMVERDHAKVGTEYLRSWK